jgi:hypothetical protein
MTALDVRLNYYGAQGSEPLPAGLSVSFGAPKTARA